MKRAPIDCLVTRNIIFDNPTSAKIFYLCLLRSHNGLSVNLTNSSADIWNEMAPKQYRAEPGKALKAYITESLTIGNENSKSGPPVLRE
jgi:hypothetical protein